MPFIHLFCGEPCACVLLRAARTVNLVTWAHAMRQVIADRAFRDTMPVLLNVIDAIGRQRLMK
jgi:hypothetical protein